MIFSVSIFSPQGKLKKKISSKFLAKRHWQQFEKDEIKRRKYTKSNFRTVSQRQLHEYRELNKFCDELHLANGRIL